MSRAETLRASLIAAGWPYDRSGRHGLYAEIDRVYLASQELRQIGCASLGLCYVACGVFGFSRQTLLSARVAPGTVSPPMT